MSVWRDLTSEQRLFFARWEDEDTVMSGRILVWDMPEIEDVIMMQSQSLPDHLIQLIDSYLEENNNCLLTK